MKIPEYVVLKDFADLQDNKHFYRTGDSFPRAGAEVSEERVAELASVKNKCGEVLIKAVEKAEISPKNDETEIAEEVVVEEKKQPKKRNKKEN